MTCFYGNHANSTSSHYDRSPCTASTRGERKPLQNKHTAYSIQRDPRTFEFAAGMGMDGNHGNSTCTHQHLASQRNSIYSTISTLHFQLLPCTWTLEATNMFEVLTQTQFNAIFSSFSLPTGAPSTRPRSTQYVRRWWHHDSAVAAVNPCSVSVGYTVPVQ